MKKIFIKGIFPVLLTIISLVIAKNYMIHAKSNSNGQNKENIKSSTKKVLVVYFSQTGNTKRLANIIANEVDADVFEIIPKNTYTEEDTNWTNENSRVVREYKNISNVSVELKKTNVDNFSSYDTVFIAYPIWFREASWVLDGFIKENDFTGKNIFTVGTSMSTGSKESGKRLEKLTNTGNWLEGERFSSNFSEEEVKTWLKKKGF